MYQSIQAGRGIAALLVVLFHLGGAIAADKYFGIQAFAVPFAFGGAGVEFFFVLSGFIILTVHRNDVSQPHKLWTYLKKRWIRIYPTYWLIFVPTFVLALATHTLQHSVVRDGWLLFKTLLLFPLDKQISGGTGAPVISVAWTLQYEIFFYVCFACLLIHRWLFIAVVAVILSAYSYGLVTPVSSFPLSFVAQDYVLLFGMGMIVSHLCTSWDVAVVRPVGFVVVGVILFSGVALDTVLALQFVGSWKILLYGLASSLILLGWVKSEDRGQTFGKHPWLQLLGDSSYAMYLIHYPLISVLCKCAVALRWQKLGWLGAIITYLLILGACLGSSIAFHLWIEKPVTSYLRKRAL